MDLEPQDKVAVVTGASKGIGLAVTRAFVDEGAHVVAGARTIDASHGIDGVTAVAVDLASPEGPAQLVARALDEHGRIDVLVNNVGGVRLRLEGFLGTSDEEFEWAMQLNFFTALRATRAALWPDGRAGRRARSSTSPRSTRSSSPTPATIDYGAAKAALVNLTKSLSQEFGPRGIRVNARLAGPGQHRPLARRGTASPRPSPRPPASTPTPRARRSSPASAAFAPAASRRPKRSPPSSCCSPRTRTAT